MIDIGQKGVYCSYSLNDTPFQPGPFMCGNDSWEKIKRNDPFLAITVTINIEGDADTSEEFFGLNRLLAQFPEVLIFNPGKQLQVRLAACSPGTAKCFIEHGLVRKQITHDENDIKTTPDLVPSFHLTGANFASADQPSVSSGPEPRAVSRNS